MKGCRGPLQGDLPGDDHQQGVAAKIASLPMLVGGCLGQISIENGSRIIGFVGRRFAHVAWKDASSCRARYHDVGPLWVVSVRCRVQRVLLTDMADTHCWETVVFSTVRRGPGSSSFSLRRWIRRSLLWVQPSLLILERLRLPLEVTEAHCECGA